MVMIFLLIPVMIDPGVMWIILRFKPNSCRSSLAQSEFCNPPDDKTAALINGGCEYA
jgi:hypothetical protein